MLSFKKSFFILVTILPAITFAEVNHYKNILVGDRAATMGGAYKAVADDSSGTYYNPAGIALTYGANISGSANVLHLQKTTFSNAIGTNAWVRTSSELLPNFFGLIKKFDRLALGFSFVVPDSSVEHQDQVFTNPTTLTSKYTMNLHSQDITDLVGASIAYKLTKTLSAGTTVYYDYRKYRFQMSQLIERNDGTQENIYQSRDQTEKGIKPVAGIIWAPLNSFSFALTYSKNIILSSKDINYYNVKPLTSNTITSSLSTYTTKRKTEHNVGVGMAYFPSPFWLITADLDVYLLARTNIEGYAASSVLNYAVGAEYFLNESNAIRLGAFTNLTNSKTQILGNNSNLYGGSAGYTMYNKTSSITLGVIYQMGSGQTGVYNDPNLPKKDFTRYMLTSVLSVSYGL